MVRDGDSVKKKSKRNKDKTKAIAADDGDANSDGVEEEVQRLLQGGTWKAMKHESSGRTYYYHTKTRQSCWDLKKEIRKQRQTAEASGGSAVDSSPAMDGTPKKSQKLTTAEKKVENTMAQSKPKADDNDDDDDDADADAAVAEGELSRCVLINEPLLKNDSSAAALGQSEENRTPVSSAERSKGFTQTDTYRDPLERLIDDTSRLEQLMASSGTSQAMALEFQRSFEALARTNKALTIQMVKMKQECDAMTMALKDANIKVYEKDLALRELRGKERVICKEEETTRSLVFLREQNQELTRQVGELTVALSRGFNELTYQRLMLSNAGAVSPEAMVTNPLQANQPQQPIGVTIDCILNNPVTQKSICAACAGELEKLRLTLLPDEERVAVLSSSATAPAVGTHHAHYVPTISSPPTFNHVGHPASYVQSSGVPDRPPLPQSQQRQEDLYGREPVFDGLHAFPSAEASSPNNAQYMYPWTGSAPNHVHESSRGIYDRPSWGFPTGAGETYADHFPRAYINRRSESRVSSMSAFPVFGGFRIRPSH